jgi:hypothetical protein
VVRLFWTMRQPAGSEETTSAGFGRPVYPNLRAESHAFSDFAVYSPGGSPLFGTAPKRLVPGRSPPRVSSACSGAPQIGRFFSAAEQEEALRGCGSGTIWVARLRRRSGWSAGASPLEGSIPSSASHRGGSPAWISTALTMDAGPRTRRPRPAIESHHSSGHESSGALKPVFHH